MRHYFIIILIGTPLLYGIDSNELAMLCLDHERIRSRKRLSTLVLSV